ncbi:MAG: F0F1 ATP synthase subunit A [Armatimonadetes bacterium]|nr:F0F1 ATP synthase subunit A [Armatimonadota bacterium]
MTMTPDEIVLWQAEPLVLNATIVFTWAVMGLLLALSWLVTRRLTSATGLSRGQNLLEVLVNGMRDQIREITQEDAWPYLPFVGTLFLFIAVSNVLAIVPGFHPPTGSLSTTGALALCVFIAVPYFGIREQGVGGYFKHYVEPTPLMLPFNLIGEISRTLALAVRLFGNIMSGSMIVAILLALAPLFFPVIMNALGLLTGLVQAYIFAVLAMVYIASATRRRRERTHPANTA